MNLNRRIYPSVTGGNRMLSMAVQGMITKRIEEAVRIIAIEDKFIDEDVPLDENEFELNFKGSKSLPVSPQGYDKKALRAKENK